MSGVENNWPEKKLESIKKKSISWTYALFYLVIANDVRAFQYIVVINNSVIPIKLSYTHQNRAQTVKCDAKLLRLNTTEKIQCVQVYTFNGRLIMSYVVLCFKLDFLFFFAARIHQMLLSALDGFTQIKLNRNRNFLS